jgi:hypothetical protein
VGWGVVCFEQGGGVEKGSCWIIYYVIQEDFN